MGIKLFNVLMKTGEIQGKCLWVLLQHFTFVFVKKLYCNVTGFCKLLITHFLSNASSLGYGQSLRENGQLLGSIVVNILESMAFYGDSVMAPEEQEHLVCNHHQL